MDRGKKLMLGGTVVVLFLGVLFLKSSGAFYRSPVDPGELASGDYEEKAVSVVGNVTSYTFHAETNTLEFDLSGNGTAIHVFYEGNPPNLAEGTTVKAVGTYDGRTFKADKLVVKCPSKYEKGAPSGDT